MAPVSCKDRQAKRRASLKDNPEAYQLHLEKERERKRKRREELLATATTDELAHERHRTKLRVQAHRARQSAKPSGEQASGTSPASTPFRTPQSRGKAVKRVRENLPASPRKRFSVITAILDSEGLSCTPPSSASTPSSAHGRCLSEAVTECVVAFFLNNDVSWQAPGRKDRVIIRTRDADGRKTKTTVQSRYMLMSLAEAHAMYLDGHPDKPIGLSKFCELRPKQVKLFDHIPHNVCVCMYHENARLLLLALAPHTTLAKEFGAFVKAVTCDDSEYECMARQCDVCKNSIEQFRPSAEANAPIPFEQWQPQGKDSTQEKVEILSSVGDVFTELVNKLYYFLRHTYVKREQAAHMQCKIADCNAVNIVLQVDFSENASISAQNEIQSAHWSHGQATLFTAYAWIEENVHESIVIVSDFLQHNRYSVYVFLDYIFNYLKEKYATIKCIDVFSDGAASQFKQRYLFSNLHGWQMQYGLDSLVWNFFATSHGKGVVDGLGGTVKRAVWRHVRSGQVHVSDAEQFACIAAQRCPNVHVKFVDHACVTAKVEQLDCQWTGVHAVPKTLQTHCVFPRSESALMVAETSTAKKFTLVTIRECPETSSEESNPQSDDSASRDGVSDDGGVVDNPTTPAPSPSSAMQLQVGEWCVVDYDGVRYPGEVVEAHDARTAVKVMARFGNAWKWPTRDDVVFYAHENIIKKIDPPQPSGNRSTFKFNVSIDQL